MDELPKFIVNLLEETGYSITIPSTSFDWMKCIDKFHPFYKWLTHSVTNSNFVTRDELLCYKHIVQRGKLLTEEKLDSKLSNYFKAEPTIYVDEVSVDGINAVITKKKKLLDQLNLLKARLKSEVENKKLENNNEEFVEQLLNDELSKVDKVEREYEEQFRCLEGKISILLENLSSLENSEPKYLCQHDLRKFLLKNANLDVYTEILKKKIFPDGESDKFESNIILDDRMNSVFNWLRNAEFMCGRYQAEDLATDEVIKYLVDCEANIDNMNYFFGKENTKNTCPMSRAVRPSVDDLQATCELYVKDIIRGTQLSVCEERLSRKRKHLLLLEELENIVKIRKLCNNSLYYLLINEWKTVRMSVSLLKEVYDYWHDEFSDYEKRMASMTRLIIQEMGANTINANNDGFSQLYNDTTLYFREDQSKQINHAQQKQFSTIIAEFKKYISNNFKQYLAMNRNINSEILKVDSYIFNGPTRCLRYGDDIVQMLTDIYTLLDQTVSINSEIKEFNKFKESFERNKNILHMMWYEWNRNPYNVIQAILKMEESIQMNRRRLSILADKELKSVEFDEFSRF